VWWEDDEVGDAELRRPGALPEIQRRLHAAATVSALLANASVEASRACGFRRGIVLLVEDGHLTATGMPMLADPASEWLRRRVLANPIQLRPGSEEGELIRRVERCQRFRPSGACLLKEVLRLEEYALAALVPESKAVALLVVDRPDGPVDDDDRAAVELFAHLLGLALERVVLRSRLAELSAEVKQFTASVSALAREANQAPIAITSEYGQGMISPATLLYPAPAEQLSVLLTDREREIAALMVSGRSNRDIGQQLHLSPDTVKGHVARVLRKLGAANRVEAVARYLTLAQPGSAASRGS
jgi:LuxR family transcriptional regulator, regulator of acetate metabolism